MTEVFQLRSTTPRRRSNASRRALASRPTATPASARDEELRAKVREVVEELDDLIRQAAA